MNDPYTNEDEQYKRLEKEYLKYGTLFIAFDFDNTIYDYHKEGTKYPFITHLLQLCDKYKFTLILFTARKYPDIDYAYSYCKNELGFIPSFVNQNPKINPHCAKPYYNILLDDRAGLGEASRVLIKLINNIQDGRIKFIESC